MKSLYLTTPVLPASSDCNERSGAMTTPDSNNTHPSFLNTPSAAPAHHQQKARPQTLATSASERWASTSMHIPMKRTAANASRPSTERCSLSASVKARRIVFHSACSHCTHRVRIYRTAITNQRPSASHTWAAERKDASRVGLRVTTHTRHPSRHRCKQSFLPRTLLCGARPRRCRWSRRNLGRARERGRGGGPCLVHLSRHRTPDPSSSHTGPPPPRTRCMKSVYETVPFGRRYRESTACRSSASRSTPFWRRRAVKAINQSVKTINQNQIKSTPVTGRHTEGAMLRALTSARMRWKSVAPTVFDLAGDAHPTQTAVLACAARTHPVKSASFSAFHTVFHWLLLIAVAARACQYPPQIKIMPRTSSHERGTKGIPQPPPRRQSPPNRSTQRSQDAESKPAQKYANKATRVQGVAAQRTHFRMSRPRPRAPHLGRPGPQCRQRRASTQLSAPRCAARHEPPRCSVQARCNPPA